MIMDVRNVPRPPALPRNVKWQNCLLEWLLNLTLAWESDVQSKERKREITCYILAEQS